MNELSSKADDPWADEKKRVTRFLISAILFWNNSGTGVHSWVHPDGVFYWHKSMSAGEKLLAFLDSLGVMLYNGRRGYRLAVRPDAMNLYADHLVNKGLGIEAVIDALVTVGCESWLSTSHEPFAATFYENDDGSVDFDCRQLMVDLVSLGYASKVGDLYIWTPKMAPILKANYFW